MLLEVLKRPRDYSRFGLNANPFTTVGVPGKKIDIYVEREKELQLLVQTIISAFRGESAHAIIIGSYGNGKTHTLRYLKFQVNEEFSQEKKKALGVYVNTIGDSLRALFGAIMFDIGKAKMEEFVWIVLTKIAKKLIVESPEKIIEKSEIAAIKNIMNNKNNGIIHLVKEGKILLQPLLEEGKRELTIHAASLDFITAFLYLILPDYSFLAWKWLCAENVPHSLRNMMGMSSYISDDQKALLVFESLINTLKYINYELFVLLIDELEAVTILNAPKKQKVLNELRHLIDLNPENLSMVIACAPEIWETLLADYHAFSDRFLHEIVLRPLNFHTAQELIAKYLETCRNRSDLTSIFPFTKDSIKRILFVTQGNVRQVLKLCQLLLDGAANNDIKEIDHEALDQLLPQFFENQQTREETNVQYQAFQKFS